VTRWLKQVGDAVQVDEPLLEVSTDKVDTEIPSPTAGTLVRITVGEDETVAVGAELGVIGSDQGAAPKHAADEPAAPAPQAEAQEQTQAQQQVQEQPPAQVQETQAAPPPQPAAQSQPPASQAAPAAPAQPAAQAAPPNGEGASQYVTPLVRKLAAEHDIDLSTINGTGVGGRIRKQDVIEAAEAKKAAAAAPAQAAPQAPAAAAAPAAATAAASELRGTTQKLTRMRKIIAQRLVESMQVSAQLTSVVEVDVTQIARLRNKVKNDFQKQNGVKLSFLPFFAKAAVEALKIHPKLNASMDVEKGEVTYHDAEHLVVAVDTERGLLVPVVHNAGDLNIAGLTKKIADLAERARTNKLVPDELAGGTFTLTNTGSRGALFDTPIFFQPQVAILGTGAVVKRAVVIDDEDLGETIAVRHMMYLALSYDHRLVDGADAARFLTTIKERLEEGKFEAEFGL
jgi:2-oxoglutarate dehydrogenase E2 component (dihydrolipoamide succinyltransferase)